MNIDNTPTDGQRLIQAKIALTDLTDQCCGQCNWKACLCNSVFFPALVAIEKELSEDV